MQHVQVCHLDDLKLCPISSLKTQICDDMTTANSNHNMDRNNNKTKKNKYYCKSDIINKMKQNKYNCNNSDTIIMLKRKDVARIAAIRSRQRKKSWILKLEQSFYTLKENNIILEEQNANLVQLIDDANRCIPTKRQKHKQEVIIILDE